jgi:pyrimidine-nucleoside phosphorylase
MTFEETGYLTNTMLHSGSVINLYDSKYNNLTGPFVDKHSTGGVGDKISLPLAPIVASCGVQIPMMSGRALGHTGGTLDKLESINGYNVKMSPDQFKKIISENGFAMIGQTEEIVPADRLLYALRDVTGTVESVPLITASILSKKVAEGSDALVFDVKCGTGAFMKSLQDAEELANSLVKTAQTMGKKASAFITDMNTPLGIKIGNFLEIEETIECLNDNGPEDVMELTYELASEMLILGEKATTRQEAIEKCKDAVKSGKALNKFLENVKAQGGNPEDLLSKVGKQRSQFCTTIKAEKDGFINIDAYKTGIASVTLGVGRNKTSDNVCADAGIIIKAKNGSKVNKNDDILEVFAKDEKSLETGAEQLKKAITYSSTELKKNPLIYKKIS